jgi:uncharacterized membrane protein
MDIPANLLPGAYLWAGGLFYALLMLVALLTAPWSKIADNEAQHVLLGTIVALCLLWVMRGGIAASLVVAIVSWQGMAGWEAFGLNVLLMGALPVLFTRVALYISQRWLAHNFYIYVFVNAFLVGALSILLVGAASASIQHLSGAQPAGTIVDNFVLILPLLMFGEGFINGGAMSLLVAYRPRWVATFHDHWYIDGN